MNFRKLNSKEIMHGFLKFLLAFIFLSFSSFMCVLFFFKSAELQHRNIEKDVLVYKDVLNKHYYLKRKIDTVYYHMTLINSGKVRNDFFLENYIAKDIQEIKEVIGPDKEGDFNYYTFLVKDLDSLLRLKNEIISISDREKLALRDLNECMGRFGKVHSELSEDPGRKFNKK